MKSNMGFAALFFFSVLSMDSFSQSKVKSSSNTPFIKDSIVYYEVEIEGRQKNYKEMLAGSWSIDTMRMQARAVPDVLSNVRLNFDTDSTFTVSTGCNHMSGVYRLKGTSIKFMNINTAKRDCEPLEQEADLQRLLIQTVSAYTVANDLLLLRDGSSNVVFRASRKKD